MRYYLCVKLRYRRWSLGCGWLTCYKTHCFPIAVSNYFGRSYDLSLTRFKKWFSNFCYSNFKYSAYPVRAYIKGFSGFRHSAPFRLSCYDSKVLFGRCIKSCGCLYGYLDFKD